MSNQRLTRCAACGSHVHLQAAATGAPCPFCDTVPGSETRTRRRPPKGLLRLGLKITAASALATTMSCGFAATPQEVYGAPPDGIFVGDAADDPDLAQDGWDYNEVQTDAGGPDEETTPTEEP